MKLKSEMQDGCVHANGYCVDEDAVELRQAEMLVHDAAAANALMLAIERLHADWEDYGERSPGEAIRIADAIMAEWGFDSGEDA